MTEQDGNMKGPKEGRYALVYAMGENVARLAMATGNYVFTGDDFVPEGKGLEVKHVEGVPILFARAVEALMNDGWHPLGSPGAGCVFVDAESASDANTQAWRLIYAAAGKAAPSVATRPMNFIYQAMTRG